MTKFFKVPIFLTIISLLILSGCKNAGDARKRPPNVKDRVQKNIEEGRGFTLMGSAKKNVGEFDFASSNELWRASLDIIEFMPLTSANYSGGIIITDWYSEQGNTEESIKITIRFLSNEVRSDALIIKVFYKNCSIQQTCKVTDRSGELSNELAEKILSKAAIYEKENKSKKKN